MGIDYRIWKIVAHLFGLPGMSMITSECGATHNGVIWTMLQLPPLTIGTVPNRQRELPVRDIPARSLVVAMVDPGAESPQRLLPS